ncbi:cupin domain-containing protein [Streptomyces sp. 3N207]|uniref:cupin domain-containing protein n=1 Tax=Streptomyces sp. 3N207 TaxID=3457417 RepID=UPI003FD22F37
MYTTPTVDYGVVLQGEIVLELDDGHCTRLLPGDIVIRNGTRHGRRNRSDQPVTMAFVLIGAERDGWRHRAADACRIRTTTSTSSVTYSRTRPGIRPCRGGPPW